MINRFKSLFDEIELMEYATVTCEVKEKDCIVKGIYEVTAKTGITKMIFKGDFVVELILDELDYWAFKKIQIAGFNPK